MDIGRPLLPQQPESPCNRLRLCCVGAEEGLGPAISFVLSPHSWAQAPRQACGFAAPTCCCLFLQTQVSLRRLGTALPSHSQRGSASPHPPRLWAWPAALFTREALRFEGWSLDQEAGLPLLGLSACP